MRDREVGLGESTPLLAAEDRGEVAHRFVPHAEERPGAASLPFQEPGVHEYLQVVTDRRLAEVDRVYEVTDARFPRLRGRDGREQAESRRVRECLEGTGRKDCSLVGHAAVEESRAARDEAVDGRNDLEGGGGEWNSSWGHRRQSILTTIAIARILPLRPYRRASMLHYSSSVRFKEVTMTIELLPVLGGGSCCDSDCGCEPGCC